MRTFLKSFLPAFVILTGACAKIAEPSGEIVSANPGNDHPATKWARVYYGATPSCSGDTKTALDGAANMFWNTGDMISLLRSSTNEQYLFNGEDGSNWSEFVKNDESVPGAAYGHTYALYPWVAGAASATEGTLTFTLPDTQPYAIKSFAQNANPMIAVTADAVSNELKFQNLCAFLQLRIYGDATVRRIRFYGNNNEILCGEATVTAAYGSAPSLALSGEGGKVLTIDCGEGGITLGASAEAYTPVWLVVPPVSFTKGFTFEIERVSGEVSTKSTAKSVTLTRGHAQPMAAFEVQDAPKVLTSFSLSDGVHSYDAFEIANDIISVQVSNQTDMSHMVASFTYEGAKVSVGGVPQESGVDSHDFSDFTNPVKYVVTSTDETTKTYSIRMFNLPIVFAETPNHTVITSKTEWIEGCSFVIQDTDGTRTDYGSTNLKGRGNSSWTYPKKPYAVKFDKKPGEKVLGMPAHKRWCLLNNNPGWYYSNLIGFELAKRTTALDWTPSGVQVELFLNGEFKGLYLFAEQIKVDKNRVNITAMSSSDIGEESITGGYLLTYDTTFDEMNKFHSEYFNMPVMFKDPDEDNLVPEQFSYLQNYINNFEASLMDNARFASREYLNYIDIDSFIDAYLVWEMAGLQEGSGNDFKNVRSVWFHKDRNDVLKAGPVWDFSRHLFDTQQIICNNAQYYGKLFQDAAFVQRIKEKWPEFKSRVKGESGFETSILDYLETVHLSINRSSERDWVFWNWTGMAQFTITPILPEDQYLTIKNSIYGKLDYLENYINSLSVNYDDKSGGNEDYGDQQDKGGDFNFGF